MKTMPPYNPDAEDIKAEIKEDVLLGMFPADQVHSVADLRKWVDVDEYGTGGDRNVRGAPHLAVALVEIDEWLRGPELREWAVRNKQ